ncbi:MAG: bifunctional DNA-formamidopyrimidine glycosylase/DNA-(apurinic or apyrimidinic site) lyase [Anaerolineae bacterium]
MPELPEVETIVRKLRPHLVDRRFVEVKLLWEGSVDRPDPAAFVRELVGSQVMAMGRRGKFILSHLDSGRYLLIHLRMTGKFFYRAPEEGPGEDPHTRVVFRLDDGSWLPFVDTRKFGRLYLVDDPEEVTACLGPEPLAPDFTAEAFLTLLEGRHGEIKRLLLNQTFVAGLGNIYANEALWQAGIHPLRTADTLTEAEARRLHAAIVASLEAGIANGGTSLPDRQYVYPDGALGGHQEQLVVYDREGDLCPRCGYAVKRIVQGQRSTYFCPVCQPK